MNNSQQPSSLFYDQSASTSRSQRPSQQMHQQSRHFDPYAMPAQDMFSNQDSAMRFDQGRFDRMASPLANNAYSYDMNQAQTWNPNAFSTNSQFSHAYPSTTRMKPQARGRAALPTSWMDPQQVPGQMPYGGLPHSQMPPPPPRNLDLLDQDEELIPTAVVIKNIPFAIRKEQLVDLMTQMNLPLPYAFNYHFDNGVFRGLAFANFTSSDETAIVIDHLNHYELQGRKLRVEYKKMLPLQERERIEREKRERRGQLEEQHRTVSATAQLQTQPSMSSMASHRPPTSPSPIGARMEMPDLNDPEVLQFYNQLLVFKEDQTREALVFPSSLAPPQRRMVHIIARHMSLNHTSRGSGEQRQVHVFKNNRASPPIGTLPSLHTGDSSRYAVGRGSKLDYNDGRDGSGESGSLTAGGVASTPNFGILRGQQSSGLLDIPQSPGKAFASANTNLRAAKSVADLRSYSTSPVPSSASYSQNFPPSVPRYQDFTGNGGAVTPSLASNGSGNTTNNHSAGSFGPTKQRQGPEDSLVNGFNNISLRGSASGGVASNPNMSSADSPRRVRGMFSWDNNHHSHHSTGQSKSPYLNESASLANTGPSSGDPSPTTAPTGAIGSNRTTNAAVGNASYESLPRSNGITDRASPVTGSSTSNPIRQPHAVQL